MIGVNGLLRLVGHRLLIHAMIAVPMDMIGMRIVACGVGNLDLMCGDGSGRLRRDALAPRRTAGDE